MEKNKANIESDIVNAMLSVPAPFTVGEDRFNLYPKSLGKVLLLNRCRKQLDINEEHAKINPYAEALRVCQKKTDIVCRMIAYSTFDKKSDVLNESKVRRRIKFIMNNLSIEELATLLLLILDNNEVASFEEHLGIDKDRAERRRIEAAKKSPGTLVFGGKSIYGTLIDFACQRYGWTMDHVVWGISYTNLMLLMSDKVEVVYLSEEERKQLNIFDNETYINADDPKNKDLVRELISY